jgi:putative ABC transport system ATP-binding protein
MKEARRTTGREDCHGVDVELRGVHKRFKEGDLEHQVLRDVHAGFRAGEFVVLLGRSGSGKSTLLNLIAGLEEPSAGSVWVGTTEVSALSEHDRTLFRRHRLGFIFQSFNLIPTLNVEENLLLPLELGGLASAEAKRSAHELLRRVGLADRRATFPDVLSGGEQQRLAVARALVHDPPLLLADEPTGNLDLDTGRDVLELLEALVRERGKTLIMVTHSREVMGHADRAFWLKGGQLEETSREFAP